MKRSVLVRLLFLSGVGVAFATSFSGGCIQAGDADGADSTRVIAANGYIGPESCRSCHVQEYEDWTKSHHMKAMMEATDSTVLGDFSGATYTADGVTSTFFKREGKFYINTEGHDGKNEDFEVKYTFGFSPLQQYLVEAPGGRMQVPRVSWDPERQRWYHQYAGRTLHHRDWMHWTGAAQNWNAMCASCHSTDLKRNYDEVKDSYSTTWSHETVTCESCHGPGKRHASFMASDGYAQGERVDGSYLHLHNGLSNVELASTCVRCHSRRSEFSDAPIASHEALDNYLPALPIPELYHADGQILDEVYVYGSFAQSKMYKYGVKCTDCHQPHTGQLLQPGNALCRQCHGSEYDSEAHTFHSGTDAPGCVGCHMPTRTYMGNDVRHDHSFRVPRPDQSVQYGTPNACTACHSNKTDAWAAAMVMRWYGPERAPHYSDRLLAGARQDQASLNALLELYADTATPAIIRATAMHYISGLPDARSMEALRKALRDPNAQVRHQAIHGLGNFPPGSWVEQVALLLTDPVRAVRMEAAGTLSTVPAELMRPAWQAAFGKAYAEYLAFMHYQSDLSTGSLMLADHYLRTGDPASAERYYLRSLRLDSLANYARLNLSSLYNGQGRNSEALATLDEALLVDGTNPRVQYNRALLLAEMERYADALSAFEAAERLGAESDRVYINHSALLQQQDQAAKAKAVLDAGLQRFPGSTDLLADMVGLLIRTGVPTEADRYMLHWRALAPQDPRLQEMLLYRVQAARR
jgi:predicted CXXCH cytochrome family protein